MTSVQPSELIKLTVYLIPSAVDALTEAEDRLGHSRTDTLNRAIQLYAVVSSLTPGQAFEYIVRPGEVATIVCASVEAS